MAIVFNNVVTANLAAGTAGTVSFTPSSNSNGILVFGASLFDTTLNNRIVGTVTYGGTVLTRIGTDSDNTASNGRSTLWYLLNPGVSAQNLVAKTQGAVTNMDYFVASYNGVHQTTPINASNNGTAHGTTNTLSVTTTVDNCRLIDVTNLNIGPGTINASQSTLMDLSTHTSQASDKAVGVANSFAMIETSVSTEDYAHSLVALAPAAAAAAGTTAYRMLMGIGV